MLPHGAVLFSDLGLPAADVLTAVTATPAAACGLAARKARLAPGYDADLLVVSGDPTTDMRALLQPWVVVRASHLVRSSPAQPSNL